MSDQPAVDAKVSTMPSPLTEPLPELPRLSVRLRQSQLLLAKPGLIRMFESIWRLHDGQSPSPFLPRDYFALNAADLNTKRRTGEFPRVKIAEYDPVLGEKIRRLVLELYPVLHGQDRQRLWLDFIDLSVCALAVRALRKQVSHKHFPPPPGNHIKASKKFLRSLERLRRRATTLAVRSLGRNQCKKTTRRWQHFIVWLRSRALGCICREQTGLTKYRKAIIDAVVKMEERELLEDGYPPQAPEVLRKLAIQLLSNVRRGREGPICIRTLISGETGPAIVRCYLRRQMVKAGVQKYDKENEGSSKRRQLRAKDQPTVEAQVHPGGY